MMNLNNIIFGFAILVVYSIIVIHSESPHDHCQLLYRIPADTEGTFFSNNQCNLQCNFTGRLRRQNINEGQICPPGSNNIQFICQFGRCLPRTTPFPLPIPQPIPAPTPSPSKNGRLKFLSTKAELSISDIDSYLMICVLNNVAEPIIRLPLEELFWSNRCYSCSSEVVRNNKNPLWTSPCPMSERYPIDENSRIIFEIWTNDSRSVYGKANIFLGGAHIRLKELINNQTLARPLSLPLTDGPASGTLTAKIEWS